MRFIQTIQELLYEKEAVRRIDASLLLLGNNSGESMFEIFKEKPIVRLFTSSKDSVEGEALMQLSRAATLDGMEIVVGMPDLHPGQGTPVGTAFASRGVLYPYLVGTDVGCGIGLWQTTLKARKAKPDKWAKKLTGLESPWNGDMESYLKNIGTAPPHADAGLGTIGAGNHFAELQVMEKILDPHEYRRAGIDKAFLFLVVHSGSRGQGEALLRSHTDKFGAVGLAEGTKSASSYLAGHDHAREWAVLNRALIARRFVNKLGADCLKVLDLCHNGISRREVNGHAFWLHRKGTVDSGAGLAMVPGSRGSYSYLVKPVGDHGLNLWSIAHGAGRKWNRGSCKGRLKAKFSADSLTRTRLGSRVICENRNLLYEEAPQAYKNIEDVIQDMVMDGLIRVVASFRPVITYKTRRRQ